MMCPIFLHDFDFDGENVLGRWEGAAVSVLVGG